MRMIFGAVLALFFLLNTQVHAQSKPRPKKPPLDPNKVIRITYELPSWNQDSAKIDTGSVFLKDANTGRIIQFQISETEPDSGKFSGIYNINLPNAVEVIPEVYIPSKSDVEGDVQRKKNVKSFQQQIETKQVNRKPFILRKGDFGEQVVDVFDNKEQMENALKKYGVEKDKTVAGKPALPKKLEGAARSVLEADQLAKIETEKKKRLDDEQKRNQERISLEQKEREKLEALRKQQEALASAEKANRKKQAQEFADTGLDFYKAGRFKEAESMFVKAHELDPENTSFYFKYGVTLFRLEKFNDALVTLKLAEGKDVDPVEKKFYVGLTHYRLKENNQAIKTFREVKATKNPTYGPSSAFYEGVALMDELKYEEAKIAFQEVLDTSNDPQLDEKAEDYIEQIERLMQFAKNKEKKFLVTGTLGLQNDSNILLDPVQAEQGATANGGGLRYIASGSFEWRPIFSTVNEFSLLAKADYIYSADSKFAAADPLVYALKAPYKYKSSLWGKGFQFQGSPGYEVVMLDEAPIDSRQNYLTSITTDLLNTLVQSEDWVTSVNLKFRSDKANSTSATGDSDYSATKITLNWNNIFFLNQKKNKAWTTDLSVVSNGAAGKTYQYTRFDLGGGYLCPAWWETQASISLLAYMANYPSRSDSRKDTNVTLNASLAKPLNDWLTSALVGSYTNNSSNVTSSTYNKFTIGLFFTANTSL